MLTFLLVPTTDPERLPLGHAHRAPIDEPPAETDLWIEQLIRRTLGR
jgi:hypothetical protein